MENQNFILIIVGYVTFSSLLLLSRAVSQIGFLFFLLLYPIFFIALFFVDFSNLVMLWVGFALLNIPAQLLYLKKHNVKNQVTTVVISTFFLWPVQFAALALGTQDEKQAEKNRKQNREKIGKLPATITGTVSFIHYIDSEPGADMISLEEYGELEFFVHSDLSQRLGIAEGETYTFTVDEGDGSIIGEKDKILWVCE